MNEHIISGNQSTFDQQVLQSELPLLVDCRAECCAPCKAMAPDLKKIVFCTKSQP